jgi:hypothetical protein
MKKLNEDWFDNTMKDSISQLSKDVKANLSSLKILEYYPYGPKKTYASWLRCSEDLSQEYIVHDRYSKMTEMELVVDIMSEVSKAMYYTIIDRPGFSKYQTIQAFGMSQIFSRGIIDWNKEITKGKTEAEIIALETKHEKLLRRVHSDYNEIQFKRSLKHYPVNERKALIEEHEKEEQKHKEANRKKYGIYEVKVLPLMGETGKPLYTKQQLAAINFIVGMSFENMC